MAIKGAKAQRLADEVLRRVGPHLPAEGQVTIVHMGSSRFFHRWMPNGSVASPIISFGTPLPCPRRLATRLAVMDAAETVLCLGFQQPGRPSNEVRKLAAVASAIDGDVVRVWYQAPDDGRRVELEPIPLAVL